MYCIIKCIVQGKQALVKNADLRHPYSMCYTILEKKLLNIKHVFRVYLHVFPEVFVILRRSEQI
jgi:hypothetical protein